MQESIYFVASWIVASLAANTFLRLSTLAAPRRLRIPLAVGMGPLLISYLGMGLMKLVPGQAPWFYASAAMVALLIGAVPTLREWRSWQWPSLVCPAWWKHPAHLTTAAVFLLALMALPLAAALPLYAHDSVGYAQAARYLFHTASLEHYPFAQPLPGGFYGPWAHPPGYIGMLWWSNIMSASAETLGPGKLYAPLLYVATLWTVWGWTRSYGRWPAALASAALLGVHLHFSMAVYAHPDAVRVFALTGAMALFPYAAQHQASRGAAAVGALVGLGLFCHVLELISLGILSTAMVVVTRTGWIHRLRLGATVFAAGIALNAPYLWANKVRLGLFLGDKTALWNSPAVDYASWIRASRHLQTAMDRLVTGLGRGYFDTSHMGLVYLGGTLMLALAVFRLRKVSGLQVVLRWLTQCPNAGAWAIFLGFSILLWASTLAGGIQLVKNPRYILGVAPAASVITAVGIGRIRFWPRLSATWGQLVLVIVCLFLIISTADKWRFWRRLMVQEHDPLRSKTMAPKKLAEHLGPNSKTLDLTQNRFYYYAQKSVVRFLSPQVVPLIEMNRHQTAEAWKYLRSLGVTHVLRPGYGPPRLLDDHGPLSPLLGDPTLANPIANQAAHTLFKIRTDNDPLCAVDNHDTDLPLQTSPWQMYPHWNHHSAQAAAQIHHDAWFYRDRPITTFVSEPVQLERPNQAHRVVVEIEGTGPVELSIRKPSSRTKRESIWFGILKGERRRLETQFLPSGYSELSLGVSLVGRGKLQLGAWHVAPSCAGK